jgi:hypothetical protein
MVQKEIATEKWCKCQNMRKIPNYWVIERVCLKNIVEMAVAGANQNLKLSEYFVLGSHSQIYDFHMVQKEIATKKWHECQNMRKIPKLLSDLKSVHIKHSRNGYGRWKSES